MHPRVSRNSTLASCIGIEDGPFLPKRLGGSKAPLVAVQLNGPHLVKARVASISVDGLDATNSALRMLSSLPLRDSPILLAGATFAGFNIINLRVLQRRFRTPTIVVIGSRPNNRAVKRALVRHFPDWRKRWRILSALGPLYQVRTFRNEGPIFYEAFGCEDNEARRILKEWSYVSRTPEPLRVAGLVARGLFPAQPLD
ncbi:DUF99 family protein [Candidatus Bathyarchaeota archaeon]|nr:MAG: DUF99 family protein [Candidatus Bathyarchaeota archaeon]